MYVRWSSPSSIRCTSHLACRALSRYGVLANILLLFKVVHQTKSGQAIQSWRHIVLTRYPEQVFNSYWDLKLKIFENRRAKARDAIESRSSIYFWEPKLETFLRAEARMFFESRSSRRFWEPKLECFESRSSRRYWEPKLECFESNWKLSSCVDKNEPATRASNAHLVVCGFDSLVLFNPLHVAPSVQSTI